MRSHLVPGIVLLAGLGVGHLAWAQQHGAAAPNIAKPNMVLQQVVEGLPTDDKQTVRVMTATFKPGDKTVYHTHRFPVTVYVLEGTFTLELDGHPPLTVKAGEALVEPPKVPMTRYNRSATEATKVVIFYVSTNDTPFLDMMSH
jgi:quercetin dioxygenase-like cupin family protein